MTLGIAEQLHHHLAWLRSRGRGQETRLASEKGWMTRENQAFAAWDARGGEEAAVYRAELGRRGSAD